MSIVLIVIYCLVAELLIFGLTFHDEMVDEKQHKQKLAKVLNITAGKRRMAKLRRRA